MAKKKRVKNAFKNFFASIWQDIKTLVKNHIWRVISFIVAFAVPFAWLITNYCTKVGNKTKFVVPFAVILPLAILVLIYWVKLKSYLNGKVIQMKTENNIEKGKHAGFLIICDTIKGVFTVLPFALVYILIKGLESYVDKISDIFLFMIVCEAIGAVLAVIDTIHNVIDFEAEEIEELENEVIENKESK